MLDTLTTLTQPWAELFSASSWLPTTVIALHVLALFVGGGIAIGADRRVVQASPGSREAVLSAAAELHATHTIVIAALGLTTISGVALFAADVGTFWSSWVFWAKMGTFVGLVLNGARMRTTEARLLTHTRAPREMGVADPDITAPWRALRRHAWVSLAGWLTVVLLGVVVANI